MCCVGGNRVVRTCWSESDVSDNRFFHVLMGAKIDVIFCPSLRQINGSHYSLHPTRGPPFGLPFTGTHVPVLLAFYVGLLCRWCVFIGPCRLVVPCFHSFFWVPPSHMTHTHIPCSNL